MSDEELLKKFRRFIFSEMPKTKKGKRKLIYRVFEAKEVAFDLNTSVAKLKGLIQRHGDTMFKTAIVTYQPPYRKGGSSSSASRPWKHSYDPAWYSPATISIEPHASSKKLKSKLLR